MTTDTVKNWAVPAVFLILPFAFLSPGLVWKAQLLFFLFCPLIIVALNIQNIWVKAFLLYLTVWQIAVFILMFGKAAAIGPGITIMLALMAGAIIFKFVSESAMPDEKWARIIRIAVIIQILIAIPQAYGVNILMEILSLVVKVEEKQPGHLVGTLGNRNFLAAFIAMSIPFFIGWRTIKIGKYTINPAIIVILAFLAGCLSPGTMAAIMGIAFYLTYHMKPIKRLAWLSGASKVAVLFAAFYIYTTGHHLNEIQAFPAQLREVWETGTLKLDPFQGDIGRFAMWMTAITKLLSGWQYAVFGFGPAAAWGREYPLHSQYISVWFQWGGIALILIGGYIFTTYRFLSRGKHLILLTSFVIICLDAVANFPAEVASTGFLIAIILGLIERQRIGGKNEKATVNSIGSVSNGLRYDGR